MTRKEKLQAIDPKDVIIFDTETTGFDVGGDRRDEVLSLAVMNLAGDILFNDMFKPVQRKRWPKAESVNGISPEMVKDKQTIEERRAEIEPIFKAAKLYVAYNAAFDLDFLCASGLSIPKRQTFDVMKEFSKIHGEWNERFEEWSWCKLEDCAAFYDYRDFGAHDALADVKATAHCFTSILDDFLFGEPRRRPKKVHDECGTLLEYGDEEYRTIVYSGYAAATAQVEEPKTGVSAPEAAKEKQQEKPRQEPVVLQKEAPELRKPNKVLVAVGVVCVVIGAFLAVFGSPFVGIPILVISVLLAIGAKGTK